MTATVSLIGGNPPMSECSAYIGETVLDTNGVPIKVCQPAYPDTRDTFLAIITGSHDHPTTVCLSANWGA